MKVKSSKLLIVFTFLLVIASFGSAEINCSEETPVSLLKGLKTVFKLSPIRPVVNVSTPTVVFVSFTLAGILGVDEKTQVLTTYIWQVLVWQNEFLVWNCSECGSYWFAVPRTNIWVPDLVINEFMLKNSAPPSPYTYLFCRGMIYDEQPIRVVSSCRLDIYLFPFDTQNCTLTFNSYIHPSSEITLEISGSPAEIIEKSKKAMSTMGEWELVGINGEKVVVPSAAGGYDEIRFYISIRRNAMLYVVNLLMPTSFLITVDLFSFLLPPQDIDRSMFKMTLVLGYTVFLLSTNDLLPITGNTVPLINVFLSMCLVMMATSLLETIFITNLMRGSSQYDPPARWIKVVVLRVLGCLVCLRPKSRKDDIVIENLEAQEMNDSSLKAKNDETLKENKFSNEDKTLQVLKNLSKNLQAIHLQVIQHLKGNANSNDWIQIGFIMDRFLFILYIIFLLSSFITIILIWYNSYHKI